jgi:HSP20 family protein
MTLVKWGPKPLNINHDFDTMINSIFNTNWDLPTNKSHPWTPEVDIKETDNLFEIKADIAGLTKKDIKINIGKSLLTISGERQEGVNERDDYYHFRERSIGTFHRTFKLPESVNQDKIKANFKNGVLIIEIKKNEEDLPKEKEIKIS